MNFPAFTDAGDLPVGVYFASLPEVIQYFGKGSLQRQRLAHRLEYVYKIACSTGKVAHFVIFGSFVTSKFAPNDIDIFMIMENDFDAGTLSGEAKILFDHLACQSYFGASVFWVRRIAALGGEQAAIEDWQIKRDGNKRGIVEIVS
ncbi:MAG: nucleotidyltransferase domain-containing protein [candidate division KSB1 bacterium]|nr:nucleotidyltransferase domain-containing protein [candidate division KSB1 bacterium]MDZ7365018.1 nucleotidyltransferase domain-containing protein [candidate division KSB1 bacterium]MDZ7403413.1 nucleotidyltransferase domain-containing protein [candidate division KSB1 bacterium]